MAQAGESERKSFDYWIEKWIGSKSIIPKHKFFPEFIGFISKCVAGLRGLQKITLQDQVLLFERRQIRSRRIRCGLVFRTWGLKVPVIQPPADWNARYNGHQQNVVESNAKRHKTSFVFCSDSGGSIGSWRKFVNSDRPAGGELMVISPKKPGETKVSGTVYTPAVYGAHPALLGAKNLPLAHKIRLNH
jgi:hypothetical protein